MAQSPKGRLIHGLCKPIHGNCAIYFYPGVMAFRIAGVIFWSQKIMAIRIAPAKMSRSNPEKWHRLMNPRFLLQSDPHDRIIRRFHDSEELPNWGCQEHQIKNRRELLYPYAPIPSASGFGVGLGHLNTFSQGIWSTRGSQNYGSCTPYTYLNNTAQANLLDSNCQVGCQLLWNQTGCQALLHLPWTH